MTDPASPEAPAEASPTEPGAEPSLESASEPSAEPVTAPTPEQVAPPRRHPKRFIAHRRIVVGVLVVFIPLMLVFGKPVANTYSYIGIPMQIAGGLILFVGLWIRLYATCWISGYKNRALLREGPYKHVRHPLYLGNTLAAIGVGLISLSPWVLGASALVMGPVFFGTALFEEGKLTDWFGDEYTEFMKVTPRFFPRGWSFNFPDYSPMPLGIVREAFTAFGYIAVAAILTALNWMKTDPGRWSSPDSMHQIFHVFNG